MSEQIPLGLRWPAHQRFETFVAGGNTAAVELARAISLDPAAPWLYLVGGESSGRTHLLIAACSAARAADRSAQYFSCRTLVRGSESGAGSSIHTNRGSNASIGSASGSRAALRALGGSDVLALDDLDAIAGDRDAEHALFDLYNRCRADGAGLLFAASASPALAGFTLPDLISRLAACAQATLKPLDDADRRAALRGIAASRGIELDDVVLDWLFARQARDLGSLVALIERIDVAALAAQRRVTVPFLREALAKPK